MTIDKFQRNLTGLPLQSTEQCINLYCKPHLRRLTFSNFKSRIFITVHTAIY